MYKLFFLLKDRKFSFCNILCKQSKKTFYTNKINNFVKNRIMKNTHKNKFIQTFTIFEVFI